MKLIFDLRKMPYFRLTSNCFQHTLVLFSIFLLCGCSDPYMKVIDGARPLSQAQAEKIAEKLKGEDAHLFIRWHARAVKDPDLAQASTVRDALSLQMTFEAEQRARVLAEQKAAAELAERTRLQKAFEQEVSRKNLEFQREAEKYVTFDILDYGSVGNFSADNYGNLRILIKARIENNSELPIFGIRIKAEFRDVFDKPLGTYKLTFQGAVGVNQPIVYGFVIDPISEMKRGVSRGEIVRTFLRPEFESIAFSNGFVLDRETMGHWALLPKLKERR